MTRPKKKILFVRRFRRPSGGQIKVADYFRHSLAHPNLEPYIYFTPDSRLNCSPIWAEVPQDRVVSEIRVQDYDCLFLDGKDWAYLPKGPGDRLVINLVQHVRHGDPDNPRFPYLSRPAIRICVSEQVREAIAPYANGELTTIEYGIPFDLFHPDGVQKRYQVLIVALKNKRLGKVLFRELQARNIQTMVIFKPLPRDAYAELVNASEIFVGLPNRTEGFYLPALEAMASRCSVVCSDAIGNRGFCIHSETALMPEYDDDAAHLDMILQLVNDPELRRRLSKAGYRLSRKYTLEHERQQYYALLNRHLFGEQPVGPIESVAEPPVSSK